MTIPLYLALMCKASLFSVKKTYDLVKLEGKDDFPFVNAAVALVLPVAVVATAPVVPPIQKCCLGAGFISVFACV